MTEARMPTTLPSPVDRDEFRFVAVDAVGRTWRWMDDELVWVRVEDGPDTAPPEGGSPVVVH